MEEMDIDSDRKISLSEWRTAMQIMSAGTSEEVFLEILSESLKAAGYDADGDYKHASANRAYLDATVMPLIADGIEQLLQTIESEALHIASGVDWVDGYMPDDWKPVDTLAMLGKYVLDHRPSAPEPQESCVVDCTRTYFALWLVLSILFD